MPSATASKPSAGKKFVNPQPELKFPKALPGLPVPVSLTTSDLNTLEFRGFFSANEKMTGMDKIVQQKNRPTGKGFCAVVIDTGVSDHADLEGAIILPRLSFNANPDKKDVMDLHGHGTHVAGIIAGRGKSAAGRGIAPEAKIISIKVTNRDSADASWWNIWNALKEAYKMVQQQQQLKQTPKDRISVINLSFNGLDNLSNDKDLGYHRIFKVIDDLHKLNVPVIVSGGNYFHRFKEYGLAYPAFNKKVISVGAVCNFAIEGYVDDSIAPFSQRILPRKLSGGFKEDSPCFLLAPGVLSASLDYSDGKGYTYMTGSSQSAPVITGAILMLQEIACKHSKKYAVALPPIKLIKECLMKGCDTITNTAEASAPDKKTGAVFYDDKNYPRVNVLKAVKHLKTKLS